MTRRVKLRHFPFDTRETDHFGFCLVANRNTFRRYYVTYSKVECESWNWNATCPNSLLFFSLVKYVLSGIVRRLVKKKKMRTQ